MIFLIVICFIIFYILILFVKELINDYSLNFENFCKDKFCSRLMKKESLDTVYQLYLYYNDLIDILPPNDTRTILLKKRFIPENSIFEVDPFNSNNYTSYILNKTHAGLCIRDKTKDMPIHDLEILKFVFTHELAHAVTKSYEHDEEFWNNFKWMLTHSYKNNLAKAIDFGKNPTQYCGMIIDSSPFYNM
jgi:hypothetical protein